MGQRTALRFTFFVVLFVIATASWATAQESVNITLPTAITFIASTTGAVTGTPSPTTITFDSAVLSPGRALRISVIADSASFTGPDGPSFPSSKVSWTVSNASGGSATAGTLSASSYTQIFQSDVLTLSGGFDVDWTLASVAGVQRGGSHTVTLRWKLEAVYP
jgi:hypothetical protein